MYFKNMKKLSLMIAIIGLGLIGTLNAQSVTGNTQKQETKDKVIKIKPFTPIFNHVSLAYEQKIKKNISGEAAFGLIGVGFNPAGLSTKSGFYLSAGPRMYFGQDWKVEGMENLPLRGFYFKPELIFSTYKSTLEQDVVDLTRDYRATSAALIMSLGRQFIAADIITLEFSAGLGYGYSNYKYTNSEEIWEEVQLDNPRFFSHLQGPKALPVAAKADITIGILLK